MKTKLVFILLVQSLIYICSSAQSLPKNPIIELTILENPKTLLSRNVHSFSFHELPKITHSNIGIPYPLIIPKLKDTILYNINEIEYKREFTDIINETGGVDISFNLTNYGKFIKKHNFVFYSKVEFNYDKRTRFVVDWHNYFQRSDKMDGESASISIKRLNDTIYTIIEQIPCGGITPEGNSYRFAGKDIDSVTGRSKAVFKVSQIFDQNEIECWEEYIYSLQTPWQNNFVSNLKYKLPVIKNISLNKTTTELIREKALVIQKRNLIEKRDSIVAKYRGYGVKNLEYLNQVYKALKARLKPNLDDAYTPNELYLSFELDYFITELTIYYKDGTRKSLVHVATYTISVL